MEEIKLKKTKQTFKEYYDANPEFRRKHLDKMLTKVACECGHIVNRCSLIRHKKTKSHERQLNAVKKIDDSDKLEKMQNEINELKQLLNKL
jgi:hypothetical protein